MLNLRTSRKNLALAFPVRALGIDPVSRTLYQDERSVYLIEEVIDGNKIEATATRELEKAWMFMMFRLLWFMVTTKSCRLKKAIKDYLRQLN